MKRDTPSRDSPRQRHAPWAMTAIVLALVALLFQGSLLPLNLAAAIFAVMGLRQVHRQPERYIGRALCWIAIALVLILAILNAMLQPPVQDDISENVPEQRSTETR
ncbi:hypothetical protein HOP62_01090 [Halomonas sp. MCCC 1A17488]|uniref:DUF4190 domain-containing protein n=1 Tax=Billgrantia sulfidoxydans TaxID=2733484 RepID=A0ABX7W5V2_9GAMM|nr:MULTISPECIES: DUF4190 domain-containing protein [Halomonas]MCE8014667.1 hypothetical protein [Halomonas sp. MCCC 1A17488]MCG3238000.1 hypothetical protein [Halomonas sp. MCCC 1A17488]QPP48220.1 hypothetical protein I4484_13310 [Halomonas sp. SS10-MC5]QTP55520.1 hypothetical protein HNO51_12995 [Halomonas sulfidoxydans]